MSITGDANQSNRFPRALRLLSASDFDQVFAKATRTGNRYFTVLLRPNDQSTARIGFVISRKSIKTAVKRNFVRRKVRELFRHRSQALPSVDLIFIAKPSLRSVDASSLDAALEVLWTRILATCDKSLSA